MCGHQHQYLSKPLLHSLLSIHKRVPVSVLQSGSYSVCPYQWFIGEWVLPSPHLHPHGETWQCLDTFLVVIVGVGCCSTGSYCGSPGMWLDFWQCRQQSLQPTPPTNKEFSNPNVYSAEVRNPDLHSSFPAVSFWSCSQVCEASIWSLLPLFLYLLWWDQCPCQGRHLHILTLVTDHSWWSYSETFAILLALPNIGIAALAEGVISTPLSIARWLVPSRHLCSPQKVRPHHLCALHRDTRMYRQLCLCQRERD